MLHLGYFYLLFACVNTVYTSNDEEETMEYQRSLLMNASITASHGRGLEKRSNADFGLMIGAKILPKCNDKLGMIEGFYDPSSGEADQNYACWCGKGTETAKMHQPQNVLDRICRAHDICYDTIAAKGCEEAYDLKYAWIYYNNQIVCKNTGVQTVYAGFDKIDQTQCKKDYCECDKAMVDSVSKEITDNGLDCPTTDVECPKRAFTMVEEFDCKNKYGDTYRDLDKAQAACDEDAKCFGINDYKCDGIENGIVNTKGNYFKKCASNANRKKRKSSKKSCVYVKDSNLNCECRNDSPNTAGGVGKSCTSSKGKYGEPWCWIKSSIKHACTDAKRDSGDNQIMASRSGWYYSTVPCITLPRPWANGYKCPGGTLEKAFAGKLNYNLDEAKEMCEKACNNRDDCLYADLFYTGVNNRQVCYLRGSNCGDWQTNRNQNYYIFQKDIKLCYCEHSNGIMPKNGLMCGTYGKSFARDGYCATHEQCSGSTIDDPVSSWVAADKKGDLCSEKLCYCEHHNGATPNNGIKCGFIGGNWDRDGYCMTHQKCTGATEQDSMSKWVTISKKGNLCG